MKHINRRFFFKYAASVPVLGMLFSCNEKTKSNSRPRSNNLSRDPEAMELSRSMRKEQVFLMLDQRVEQTMEKSHNCAQTTFYALSEQFGLGGDDVLKALTPLPGIAERGQTCGAITGALMAMGLIYGREQLDDWEKYRSSLIPANKFCENFEKDMETTQCCEIQDRAFGQSYNLMDPDQLKEFQRAGATTKCTKVVQKACRLAAEIILENNGKV
jgi:C_GCAxxG_C_C family probable redox protein